MSLDAIEAEFKNGCSEDFSKDDFMFWKKRGAFRKKAGSEFEQLVHFRILDIGSLLLSLAIQYDISRWNESFIMRCRLPKSLQT